MKNKLKSFQEKQNAKSGMVQNAADTNESTGILFPDEHPQEQEKKDLQLSLKKAMDKTANVSLEIVDKLRNLQRIRDEIREFRVKNQKIRTTHRHMVKQLEEARKSQQERSHNVEQQAEVKRAEDEVEVQARKNDVLRHVLRNLVIESGEEWVNNAGLVDLVLTLDDTAAEKLENFQSNEEEVTSMSTRSEI
ncbi:DgyrCDS11876 [Dimorphilus gyrociliatus]|uniref:DgyrCDS11876 n=1 Tax=Dimorphilus gyrociliatus TaxID=2664684 RepID=A0A7I8W4S2_9ANNE|nr:DgyrCDS11876 [Dimorphilus gyrociliatus]